MRARGLIVVGLGLAGLCLGGCSVGKGVGAAKGTLFELGCSSGGDYCSAPGVCGKDGSPVPYDLRPSFFAGEPINDLRQQNGGTEIMNNRLTIRLQRSGKEIEQNDVLTFDIASSYEVARCVRGRFDTDKGMNDWDENTCYRASDNGPGRMRVQYDSQVRAALTLKATCTGNLVASAVSAPVPTDYTTTPNPTVTDGSWLSWVDFQEFGGAAQIDKVPQQRDPISNKFYVGLGEPIHASAFALNLVDDQVVNAAIHDLPQPAPSIGGALGGDSTTGWFAFDLERGQGAQFFP